jgi:hypothetical protein
MTQVIDTLPDDPNELKAILIAERVRNERIVQIIKELQRHRFGRHVCARLILRTSVSRERALLMGVEFFGGRRRSLTVHLAYRFRSICL